MCATSSKWPVAACLHCRDPSILTHYASARSTFCRPGPGRRPPLGTALAPTKIEAVDGFVTVDLGLTEAIRAVTVDLRWRYAEIGPRMLVETSRDGASWQPGWEGFVGEAALTGALLDQQVVPMTLYLPDTRARYLRLSHAPPWVARELTLHGAAR